MDSKIASQVNTAAAAAQAVGVATPQKDSSFLVLAPTESTVEIKRRDSSFLELVPVASDSYPQTAPGRYSIPGSAMITPLSNSTEKVVTPAPAAAVVQSPPASAEEIEERVRTRRSSSIDSSGSAQRRFLKLGPVHFGGEAGVPDYCQE